MSSEGDDLSEEENSSENNMVFEELEGGRKVGMTLHTGASSGIVCIDTGGNRVILIDRLPI